MISVNFEDMTTREPALPVFLLLKDRRCLVIGNGPAAQGRVLALLEAGAQVTVVTKDPSPAVSSSCTIFNRTFQKDDLEDTFFVVAASTDAIENADVARQCHERGIPINVVDDLEASSVIFPAIARRAQLTVAVSSNGTSPAMATYLRDSIAPLLTDDLEQVATLLEHTRHEIRATGRSTEGLAWHRLIAELLGALAARDNLGVERILKDFLDNAKAGDHR